MLEFFVLVLPSTYIIYILGGLALLTILSLSWALRLELKCRRMLRGKNVKDLESSLLGVYKDAEENDKFRSEMRTYLLQVEKRLRRALQSTETVRFDALAGNGTAGNQSFATAYVNEKGDGVIISSLSVRERTSVFSKPIKDWKSSLELSPEEKEALEKAKQKLTI